MASRYRSLALLTLIFCGGGCRDRDQEPARLLLYCGAGIRPAVAELAEMFTRETGVNVETTYAGSEVLLAQLQESRRGDLYLPGDQHYVDLADERGLILSRRRACYWVPTILVRRGNPKGVTGLKDLLRSDVKWGLGDARTCAIGRTSREIIEKNDLDPAEVEKNVAFQSATVNELGLQIQAKSLDAVIVWDAIAHYYADYGDEVPIPADQNIISTVEIGVLKFTKDRELAERFAEFVTSEQGQAVFAKHNYRVDAPEPTGEHQADDPR